MVQFHAGGPQAFACPICCLFSVRSHRSSLFAPHSGSADPFCFVDSILGCEICAELEHESSWPSAINPCRFNGHGASASISTATTAGTSAKPTAVCGPCNRQAVRYWSLAASCTAAWWSASSRTSLHGNSPRYWIHTSRLCKSPCGGERRPPLHLSVHSFVRILRYANLLFVFFLVETLQGSLKDTECSICFGEFEASQVVARLACLCLFHQNCIGPLW